MYNTFFVMPPDYDILWVFLIKSMCSFPMRKFYVEGSVEIFRKRYSLLEAIPYAWSNPNSDCLCQKYKYNCLMK